mgnify:CR=1 FL=1
MKLRYHGMTWEEVLDRVRCAFIDARMLGEFNHPTYSDNPEWAKDEEALSIIEAIITQIYYPDNPEGEKLEIIR